MTDDDGRPAAPNRRARSHAPDRIELRDAADLDGVDDDDGVMVLRMPVTSTAEARDGEAFDRDRVEGIAEQIEQRRIPLFLDHGRNEATGARYSALGKVGYLRNPDVVDRGAATDVDADYVLMDPAAVDDGAGARGMRAALSWIRAQADAGLPLASSISWREHTGDRDLPGDVDLLECSLVGIPSDLRTSTDTAREGDGAASPAVALARSLASAGGSGPVTVDPDALEAAVRDAVVDETATGGAALRQVGDVETVRVPDYDPSETEDTGGTDRPDLEDFGDGATPQDEQVWRKFAHSSSGFPPAADAEYGTLNFPLVSPDGTVHLDYLKDALRTLPTSDLSASEKEAVREAVVQMAADAFPGADLPGTDVEDPDGEQSAVGGDGRNLDDPEFSAGDAVMWPWDGDDVHGRVNDVHESYTPPGADEPIEGDEGEAVYSIYEWEPDGRTDEYADEPNVAKPESSLNESTADLPPLDDRTLKSGATATDGSVTDGDTGPDGDDGARDGAPEWAAELSEAVGDLRETVADLRETVDGGGTRDGGDAGDDGTDADGETRTVEIDGDEVPVDEAVDHLRSEYESADVGDGQTRDTVDDGADEETVEQADDNQGRGFGLRGVRE
jgi:hypothetical protein